MYLADGKVKINNDVTFATLSFIVLRVIFTVLLAWLVDLEQIQQRLLGISIPHPFIYTFTIQSLGTCMHNMISTMPGEERFMRLTIMSEMRNTSCTTRRL